MNLARIAEQLRRAFRRRDAPVSAPEALFRLQTLLWNDRGGLITPVVNNRPEAKAREIAALACVAWHNVVALDEPGYRFEAGEAPAPRTAVH